MLKLEKNRLANLKISLQNRQTELETLCQKPDSMKKIELIVTGILRKNLKFVRSFEEVDSKLKQLSQRIQHTKKHMEILKIHLSLGKCGATYKIESSDNFSNSSGASLIADAILREPEAVQLVARSAGNNLEMEKNWGLMSELDKDALIRKKILRELGRLFPTDKKYFDEKHQKIFCLMLIIFGYISGTFPLKIKPSTTISTASR